MHHSKFGNLQKDLTKEVSFIKVHLKAFLKVATMHGLKYLTKRTWVSEITWIVLVTFWLGLAVIFQIIPSLNAYNQIYRESQESTFDSTEIQVILRELFQIF